MSMIYVARALTVAELRLLRDEPTEAHRLIAEQPEDPRATLDLDTAWHALHVLLTGRDLADSESRADAHPLDPVIVTGRELTPDDGPGSAMLVEPVEVRRIDDLLQQVTVADLRARFDPDAFTADRIYPDGWHEPEVFDTHLARHFTALQTFWHRAAGRGNSVLHAII